MKRFVFFLLILSLIYFLKPLNVFASVRLYDIGKQNYYPTIYLSDSVTNIKTLDELNLDFFTSTSGNEIKTFIMGDPNKNDKDIVSFKNDYNLDKPKVEYKKVTPTSYQIRIKNAPKELVLIFNQRYHEGWKLSLSSSFSDCQVGEKYGNFNVFECLNTVQPWGIISEYKEAVLSKKIFIGKHFLANGYSNGYFLKSDNSGDVLLSLDFEPQRSFYAGISISVIFLLSLLIAKIFFYLCQNDKGWDRGKLY